MTQVHTHLPPFQSGKILLVLTLFTLFVLPVLPAGWLHIAYPACFMGLVISAAFSLQNNRRLYTAAALSLTALLLIGVVANMVWVQAVSRSLQIVYFMIVVLAMVREIASSKQVDEQVIVHAITAYFLLGMALALVAVVLGASMPGAYNLQSVGLTADGRYAYLGHMIYYTFTTYTTTGYGDVLPLVPASRMLAIFIASCGQLYIAIILAMLVGKYSSLPK